MLGCADTGYHVFALSIDQELAVELVLPGGWITGERHASSRILTHVAEYHGLDVDRRTQQTGDFIDLTVAHRAGDVPALEHRLNGLLQLMIGILGKAFPGSIAVDLLIGRDELFQPGLV